MSAKLRGLDLRFKSDGERLLVSADPVHLKRIFSNILSNGLKYTKRGFVAVSTCRDGPQSCSVKIEDSGIGLTEEQQQRLFTPFVRFHEEAESGIGLGLALSKTLVELNGGTLRVRSKQGKGSCFEVSFPQVKIRHDASRAARTGREETEVSPRAQELFVGIKVLIVDDEPECVDSLARVIGRAGCEIFRATSVGDAVSLANYQEFDAVISDISMPDGGGKRLIDFMQAIPSKPPLLMLSGHQQKDCCGALPEGMKVLQKPVEPQEIMRWLEESAGRRAPRSPQQTQPIMVA